jgi:phospholipase/lecithinase/hemolysin
MDRFSRVRCPWLAALLVSLAALNGIAAAGPFSNLVVFGDSLSDVGNIAQAPFINTPGPYYWNGRFSNGPVYAETLATGLGLTPLVRSTASGGNGFAYGGAKTTGTGFPDNLFVKDIDDQVGLFLSSRSANDTTLYVVFAGANDLLGGQTNMSIPVNSLSTSINRLVTAGARNFLIFNLPPLGNTPRLNGSQTTLNQYNSRTQQFNAALATMLDGLQAGNPALTVYRLDIAGLVSQALATPQAFGLTNVTSPAAPGLEPGDTSYDTSLIAANPNQYLFWDELHPTAWVHAVLGQRAVQLFYAPGDFNHDSQVDAADYLVWRKSTGAGFIPSDFDTWRAHFGQTTASGNELTLASFVETSVPEPRALIPALFVIGLAAASIRCKTRHSRHIW